MAKNREKPRPGVVFRFEWISTLEKLGDEAKAQFLMACLYRGHDLTYQPDYSELTDMRDQIRLETLWEQAAPLIDADGQGWADTIVQRKYAGYCSGCKRTGEEPMLYDEYLTWYETAREKDLVIV